MVKDKFDRALKAMGERRAAEEENEAIIGFLSSKWTWIILVGIGTAWFILRGLRRAGNKDHIIDGILDTLHLTDKYEEALGVAK